MLFVWRVWAVECYIVRADTVQPIHLRGKKTKMKLHVMIIFDEMELEFFVARLFANKYAHFNAAPATYTVLWNGASTSTTHKLCAQIWQKWKLSSPPKQKWRSDGETGRESHKKVKNSGLKLNWKVSGHRKMWMGPLEIEIGCRKRSASRRYFTKHAIDSLSTENKFSSTTSKKRFFSTECLFSEFFQFWIYVQWPIVRFLVTKPTISVARNLDDQLKLLAARLGCDLSHLSASDARAYST